MGKRVAWVLVSLVMCAFAVALMVTVWHRVRGGSEGQERTPTPTPATAPSPPSPWHAIAIAVTQLDRPGATVRFACPPSGEPGDVFGTDPYHLYSSICTAAVHAGRITLTEGGEVTVLRTEPELLFGASVRNGITAGASQGPAGAFSFAGVTATSERERPRRVPLLWDSYAVLPATAGARFTFECPPGTHVGPLWGTDFYSLDSAPCSAATHAGAITPQQGGIFTVEVRGRQASFEGSQRHGVTSSGFGGPGTAFAIVPASPDATAQTQTPPQVRDE
jgi:hypothetical protein